MQETRSIREIRVGTRHRKDLGDIRSLADSIEVVGLLHAVVIDKRNRLIAGRRRLEAARLLGWKTVPVRVVDLEAAVEGEFHENAARKDFTPSEIAGIARALRPLVEARARRRKVGRLKRGQEAPDGENIADGERGRAVDLIGRLCGVSGRTLEKIEAVCQAAEEDPDRYTHLVEEMDSEPRSVHRVHQRLQRLRRQQEAQADCIEPTPGGKFTLRENEIVCGDCRELLPNIPDATFHAVITDPPYGIGHRYNGQAEATDDPEGYWRWFEPVYKEMLRVLKPGGFCAIFQGGRYMRHFWEWFGPEIIVYAVCREPGSSWRGGQPIACCWDPVVLLFKGGGPRHRSAQFVRARNWFVTSSQFDDLARVHPCPEPLDVCEELVRSFTCGGALVLDPFAGVGSIPLACSRLGRRYAGIEVEPKYVRAARTRLKTLGGGG